MKNLIFRLLEGSGPGLLLAEGKPQWTTPLKIQSEQ